MVKTVFMCLSHLVCFPVPVILKLSNAMRKVSHSRAVWAWAGNVINKLLSAVFAEYVPEGVHLGSKTNRESVQIQHNLSPAGLRTARCVGQQPSASPCGAASQGVGSQRLPNTNYGFGVVSGRRKAFLFSSPNKVEEHIKKGTLRSSGNWGNNGTSYNA